MPVSYETQAQALRIVAERRPADLVRAGLVKNIGQAELLLGHFAAAKETLDLCVSNERVRRTVDQARTP